MFDKPGRERQDDSAKRESSNIFDEADAALRASQQSSKQGEGVDDLRRRQKVVENLLNVSASVNAATGLEELLERIVDSVVKITGCRRGYLMLAEKGKGLSVAVARSAEGESFKEKHFDVSLSVIRRAATTGEPQYVTNAQEEDELREQRSLPLGAP